MFIQLDNNAINSEYKGSNQTYNITSKLKMSHASGNMELTC
jgi:hypothetical protein